MDDAEAAEAAERRAAELSTEALADRLDRMADRLETERPDYPHDREAIACLREAAERLDDLGGRHY